MLIKRIVRAVIMAALAVGAGVIVSPFVYALLEGFCPVPGMCMNQNDAFFAVFGAAFLLGVVAKVLLVAAAIRGVFWTSEANNLALMLATRSAMVCLGFNVLMGMMLRMADFSGPGLPTFAIAIAATLIPLLIPSWFLGEDEGNG